MHINTRFRGRIVQVSDTLDFGDAVSNQIVALDRVLRELGFDTAIHTYWYHEKVAHLRRDLSRLTLTDCDIVLVHYAGFGYRALPAVLAARCTRVLVYHNITPHTFFPEGSRLYDFCRTGREQLATIVHQFHAWWGDSQYNVDELIALGAPAQRCTVLPIIVEPPAGAGASAMAREPGRWMFLGRIAENKGQHKLVELFQRARARSPGSARSLYLVGNFDPEDAYYRSLVALIGRLGLQDHVTVTGKLDDADVVRHLATASLYVSASEHEGFGVPLVEAAHFGVPVLALRNTAVGETLGHGPGLADDGDALLALAERAGRDPAFRAALLAHQQENARRFRTGAVRNRLADALRPLVPDRYRFSRVSIVICTYNRADLLDRCLDYLDHQTDQRFEVIVVNGPSTDATEEVIARHAHRLKVARNPERNLSKSRNLGIELADGDLIAFIDDDALPFDDWVATLLDEFNERPLSHVALGGPAYFSGTLKFQAEDIGFNERAEARVNIDSAKVGTDGWERSMLGTNTCFRADVLRAQGFDEQFDYFLDESELSFRLQRQGWIVGYSPDLHLRHEFAQSANRRTSYDFNWFSIYKNTAYFIAAYSGLQGAELDAYLADRIEEERLVRLRAAVQAGQLRDAEFRRHEAAIREGIATGLVDARQFPRTRALRSPPGTFLPFATAAAHPLVQRDLRALHVCIVSKEFPPFAPGGGIGTLYYHLASELLLMGHRVTVVSPGESPQVHRAGRFCWQAHPIRALSTAGGPPGFVRNANWSLTAMEAVAAVHAEDPVDVIDSALWDSEALALALLPRASRPPLVVRLVTPYQVAAALNGWQPPPEEAAAFVAAERRLIEHADAVVAISDSILETVQRVHGIQPSARWTRSYCGIAYWPSFDPWKNYTELSSINGREVAFPADARVVLFVGRLEARKGIDLLLRAAADFLAPHPEAHLVLAGNDPQGWGQRFAADAPAGIAGRVHFLGEVDDATRDKLLHGAWCTVFPSRYESFGLVPLESFVHGVPVVATRDGAIPEVVVDDGCGLLFDTDDAPGLAACVRRLLAEPPLRQRLALGAQRRIRELSSRRSAIESVRLYARLVDEPTRIPERALRRSPPIRVLRPGWSSWDAADHRLFTQCGDRSDGTIRATGAAGLLLHGPYVDVSAGRYRADLYGSLDRSGAERPFMEAAIRQGTVQLAQAHLGAPDEDGRIGSLEFVLEEDAQLEVRVRVDQDAAMAIRRLVLMAEGEY